MLEAEKVAGPNPARGSIYCRLHRVTEQRGVIKICLRLQPPIFGERINEAVFWRIKMSIATYAQFAETVTLEFVKEHCGKIYVLFNNVLERENISLDEFAFEYDEGADRDIPVQWVDFEAELTGCYEAVMAKFKEQTDLDLQIRYHTKEDDGDEASGTFWEIEGVYMLTLAGKKHQKDITRMFWTTWG